MGVISIEDAMAAKCQVIVRKQTTIPDILVDGETAYIAEFSETITSLIKDYIDGQLQPTVENAYKAVCKHDLVYFGERLVWFYKQQIEQKKL